MKKTGSKAKGTSKATGKKKSGKTKKEKMDEKRRKLLGEGLAGEAADKIMKRQQRIKQILNQ